MSRDLSVPPFFPAYFDHRKGRYLMETKHGWAQFSKEDLQLYLLNLDLVASRAKGEISDIEWQILRIQTHNKIDHAGPVAGHKKGLVTMGGSRVLVTQSYEDLVPVNTPWPLLSEFLTALSDRINPKQKPIFFSWCQGYLKALRAGIFMPGQALVLAGPHQCGKSFLQNRLTRLFGGRSANPWPYLSEATEFNSELFGAEHLQVEDP